MHYKADNFLTTINQQYVMYPIFDEYIIFTLYIKYTIN